MNTNNENTEILSMAELAAKYKKAADEKMKELSHLSRVSQDSAYREGFRYEALCRAKEAAETGKVFFGGYGRGVLIVGISALAPEKLPSFIASCGGWKSHANSTLLLLDGEKGEIRKNKAGTCWVIDLASRRSQRMFGWTASISFNRWDGVRYAGPKLNTTNGAGHWCGLTSAALLDPERNPASAEFIRKATACWDEHGMTPIQWQRVENARQVAENNRRIAVLDAAFKAAQADGAQYSYGGYGPQWGEEYRGAAIALAGESGPVPENLSALVREKIAAAKLAAEEIRIMAELEAEQIKLAREKVEAEAAAKQQAEIEKTCRLIGVSPAEWQGMTPKKQGLALHRARLAGKL